MGVEGEVNSEVEVEAEVSLNPAGPEGTPNPTPTTTVEPKIEEIVTPKILTAILDDYKQRNAEENIELIDFTAKAGTIAGDNYMSIIYAVKLNLKNTETNEKTVLPVMLKVLPRNEMRVKIINDGNIFVRDVNFYNKIIPALENFQRSKGLSGPDSEEIFTPWPKCFSSKTDGKTDYLAMEDLKSKGYKMASRKLGLDLDHCKLVIKSMAKFHAVSYAMFGGKFESILEAYPWLEETMFKEDKIPPVWKDMIKHTYQQQAENLRGIGENLGAYLLDRIYSDDYFKDLYELVGGKARWAVIGHGDCWTNNFLFKYDEETEKPIDVKFVDFQVSRASSRCVDIHYFLHSSPQIDVLNKKEGELEDIYFEEFTNFVRKLGIDTDAEELTKENFLKEIEDFRYYGVTGGFMLALVTSAEAEDVPEMENMTEEEMMNGEEGKNILLGMMKERAMEKVKNLAGVHLQRCEQMKKYLEK